MSERSRAAPQSDAPPPADYLALTQLLQARAETLPKRLRQVARYAIEHPDEMAFEPVAGVAAAADVQPSTVVRFAQALGFTGFSQMQALFRVRLRGAFPDYGERVARLDAQGRPAPLALFDAFADSAVASLERLRAGLSPETLERSVDALAQAETIYLVGVRRVFPVVAYLAYAFAKLGLRAVLVDHVAQLGPEQIAFAGPRDAALAISFAPYAAATLDLTRAAAAGGARVVAITDSPFSPLVGLSHVWIEAAEADVSGFRSLSASLVLALTLAVAAAERRGAESARPARASPS